MARTARPDHRHPEAPYWLSEPADLLTVLDRDGRIESVSPSCVRLLDRRPQELIGRSWRDIVAPEDVAATQDFIDRAFGQHAEMRGFANRLQGCNGREVHIEWTVQAVDAMLFAAGRDVTPQRRMEEMVLRSEDLIRTAFEEAPVGMCLATLSGFFFDVNPALARMLGRGREDMIGLHIAEALAEGDRQQFSENLERLARGGVTQYRAERRFDRPDGRTVWTEVAVRLVTMPHGERGVLAHVTDVTDRKREQRLLARDLEQLTALEQLRAALRDDRLVLYWQPIVDLTTSRVTRHEVLVRLEHDGEIVTPDRFLGVAERFGLIADVDHAVVRKAVGLAAAGWTVNVNISALSLGDPRILGGVAAAAERGLDSRRVCFEITETALAEDMDVVVRFAREANELGCRMAIDDFGAGYGGLVYLRHLGSLSCALKIDRGFIASLTSSPEDQRIVAATVGLARGFGLDVVAEGVEDAATASYLVGAGVTHAQGWLYGRPQPAVAVAVP